ncbi:MAG: vitamin B12-dependent ribonucleotide reductase [Chloroflexi bacterium]|nr:vitamin B12-dependent ribonucleotide reductase [Chloroflexota bacterium]
MKKDLHGRVVETPDEMFRRVAWNLAQAELLYNPQADAAAWAEEFYQIMANLEFLPNSPALANAGRELQQLSACFVLPVEDSLDKIFDSVKHAALIHKTGGGTGFAFGRLRPANDIVQSTGQVASGPVSFMKVFDAATEAIKQGGMRRGANMGILSVTHPDIQEFITCKADMVSVTNFNISVTVTEEFMRAVEEDRTYDLTNPRTGQVSGQFRAREVFQQMVENAWKNGDPGIVFIDRVNRDHPCPHIAPVESTNPCGEQPLMPYESCNLGSLNLSKMVRSNSAGQSPADRVDWERLAAVTRLATRFLDNVIDMNKYVVPEIEVMTKATRKIGLGVMGWADLLLQLGVPYDSEEALRLAEAVMDFINRGANEASVELAGERGVFPTWEGSIYDYPGGPRYRNSTRTTIAPTGTISLIAGASSGVEPVFALSFMHHGLEGAIKERFVNPFFEAAARGQGFYSEELMDEVAAHGSCHDVAGVPEEAQRVFVTAHDITPEWHVRMQAAFQRYTDNAVSKTINFPAHATVDDVWNAYMLAYREGCKGITIYRDSSRAGQVLTAGNAPAPAQPAPAPVAHWQEAVAPRPDVLDSKTIKQPTPFGNLYVTVSEVSPGEPFEVFATIGKAGSDIQAMTEAACRAISQLLRLSAPLPRRERLLLIIEQFEGIGGYATFGFGNGRVRSIPDAIAKALRRYLGVEVETPPPTEHKALAEPRPEPVEGLAATIEKPSARPLGAICPDCGQAAVYYAEGCMTCQECGWSQC